MFWLLVALHRAGTFAAPHPMPAVRKLGQVRKVEGTELGQLIPGDPRGIPGPTAAAQHAQLGEAGWGLLLGTGWAAVSGR